MTTTVSLKTGWYPSWTRCCWSRTLRWVEDPQSWYSQDGLCNIVTLSNPCDFFKTFFCFRALVGLPPRWSTGLARRSIILSLCITGRTRWVLVILVKTKPPKRQSQSAWNDNADELEVGRLKSLSLATIDSVHQSVNVDVVYVLCQNNIPVFSPALTDGSLGDMIYFHSFKNPGLILDIVEGKSNNTATEQDHHSCCLRVIRRS